MEQNAAPENINTQESVQTAATETAAAPETAVTPEAPETAEVSAAPKSINKRAVAWICIIFALVLILLVSIVFVVPAISYNKAMELYTAGKYEEAQAAFLSLGAYKDSPALAVACENDAAYEAAEQLYEAGNYEDAKQAFEALGEYKDGAARAAACGETIQAGAYAAAQELFEQEKYDEAKTAFEALGNYADSEQRARECALEAGYISAVALFESEDYEKAVSAFVVLGSFRDAPDYVLLSKYSYVKAHEDRSDSLTRTYLTELSGIQYKDSAEIMDRLVNSATMEEFVNSANKEYISLAFCLLPGEKVRVVLPSADDVTYSNSGSTWMEMKLDIPKDCYYPKTPLSEPEYIVTPQVEIEDWQHNSRSLVLGSFTLVFPTVELVITEPETIPEEGVMCGEDNKLRISGTVTGQGATVLVNGTSVPVDNEGCFMTTWTLSGTEAETVTITASANNYVTSSMTIRVLPHVAPSQPTEPQITYVPEGSNMFNDPLSGVVISADSANVYAGPGEEYALLASVSSGEHLDAIGTASGWFLVEYRDTSIGWINGANFFGKWMFDADMNPFLMGIAPAAEYMDTPLKLTVTAQTGAGMYEDPDAPEIPLYHLDQGTECICFGSSGDWYLCCSGDSFGWIDKSSLA